MPGHGAPATAAAASRRAVTMKDIAGAAGVAPSTVSRILNDVSTIPVAPDTRARVIETASVSATGPTRSPGP